VIRVGDIRPLFSFIALGIGLFVAKNDIEVDLGREQGEGELFLSNFGLAVCGSFGFDFYLNNALVEGFRSIGLKFKRGVDFVGYKSRAIFPVLVLGDLTGPNIPGTVLFLVVLTIF
jgi:hypothetical protein